MDRRAFLGSMGLAAGSAGWCAAATTAIGAGFGGDQPVGAAGGATAPLRGDALRTLKKAVMFGMIGEGADLGEKFRILKDSGFDGVEMDSPTSLSMDEIRAQSDKAGIVVHGLVDSAHWRFHLNNPVDEMREKGLEALRTCISDAGALGCSSILLVPALVNGDMFYDEAYRLSQEAIRSVLPLAEAHRVRIAVENVWNNFLLSPLEAARYVDELNSPWVAFHFDIGNVINFGWPAQWIRILGRRIVKLHIKDFSRKKRDDEGLWKGFDVELGAGDAGWADIMKALDEVGYSTDPAGQWATAEVRGGDGARLREIAGQMDALFAL